MLREPKVEPSLWALMVGRLATFPAGGRGTDRGIVEDEDPGYDRMLLWGGRGTL